MYVFQRRPVIPLDGNTPPGLFISESGDCSYWVITVPEGVVAVHLLPFDRRPMFSFLMFRYGEVSQRPLLGFWEGEVLLELCEPVDWHFPNECGLIINWGNQTYLKCCGPDGRGKRVMLDLEEISTINEQDIFHPYWQLKIIRDGSLETIYDADPLPLQRTNKRHPNQLVAGNFIDSIFDEGSIC